MADLTPVKRKFMKLEKVQLPAHQSPDGAKISYIVISLPRVELRKVLLSDDYSAGLIISGELFLVVSF